MKLVDLQKAMNDAERIWMKNAEAAPDSYWCFRRAFHWETDDETAVSLAIAADTQYSLYINGRRIQGGQYPSYPQKMFFTVYEDIRSYLNTGNNTIAVSVYHLGVSNATHVATAAGLVLVMSDGRRTLKTDGQWRVSQDSAFVSGACRWMSFPVGMRFEYNANKEEKWTDSDYDDRTWSFAEVLPRPATDGSWGTLAPRPIPACRELPPAEAALIWQGETFSMQSQAPSDEDDEPFLRHLHPEKLIAGYSDSWNCGDVTYPIRKKDGDSPLMLLPASQEASGVSLVFDLGREMAGFLLLEWECEEPDVTMEIHHGEHLDDGRVRSRILCARYIDTIHLGQGRHRLFYPMRRLGTRYVQLFISRIAKPLKLHYVGLSEQEFPVPKAVCFQHPDNALGRLMKLSARTLQLCMHDHYEDCPWREQSLYAGDSRVQMLCGYYVWGNYDFAEASLDLLSQRYFDDCGFLSLCAPSGDEMTIASYSFIWIAAVREFVLYSGRKEFFGRANIRLRVDQILQRALARPLESIRGLYRAAKDEQLFNLETGGRVWNFYEWCGELSCDNRIEQLLYQCYLAEALYAAADLHSWDGNVSQAEKYRSAAAQLMDVADKYFWDEHRGCYTAFLPNTPQKYYEHVQSMMLLVHREMSAERRHRVCETMGAQKLERCTWYNWLYFARAMAHGNAATRQCLQKRFQEEFLPFAFNGATALWELPNGGYAGRFGCSLCHGWSAVPVWYAGALMLGVEPVAPGFRKFRISPVFNPGHLDYSGEVPTPYGKICVSNSHGVVSYTAPAGLTGVIEAEERFSDTELS